jgi:hypothetical protein
MFACCTKAIGFGFFISAMVSIVARHWLCAFRASRMYISSVWLCSPKLRAARIASSVNMASSVYACEVSTASHLCKSPLFTDSDCFVSASTKSVIGIVPGSTCRLKCLIVAAALMLGLVAASAISRASLLSVAYSRSVFGSCFRGALSLRFEFACDWSSILFPVFGTGASVFQLRPRRSLPAFHVTSRLLIQGSIRCPAPFGTALLARCPEVLSRYLLSGACYQLTANR